MAPPLESEADVGAAIGISFAIDKIRPGAKKGNQEDIQYQKKVVEMTDQFNNWRLFTATLGLVENDVGVFRSGLDIARKAGADFATTEDARSWAAEILVTISEKTFLKGHEQGLGDKENVKACVKAVWAWIIPREADYRKKIERSLNRNILPLVKDNYDPYQLVGIYDRALNSDLFKAGIPDYQDFYARSFEKIKAELEL